MLDRILSLFIRLLGLKGDFQQIFFRNELKSLLGKGRSSLYVLTLIYTLTWLSLGYAIGGLSTLAKRMENPYTNWVDWAIPSGNSDILFSVQNYLSDPVIRDSFFLKDVQGYGREMRLFLHNKTKEGYYKRGRTMEFDEELFQRILRSEDNNVLAGLIDIDENTDIPMCGLVVRAEMLRALGYDEPADQRILPVPLDSQIVYLPIIAVVQDLPNLCDFICSPNLFNALNESFDKTGFLPSKSGSAYSFSLLIDEPDADKVAATLRDIPGIYPINKVNKSPIVLNSREMVYRYQVVFEESYPSDSLSLIVKSIKQHWPAPGKIQDDWEWECPAEYGEVLEAYYAAFNFKQLDRVRPFKRLMQERFGVELSMDQIEAKENFALVSNLTYLISIGLFLFSIISIILFINSKLRNHLEQNKANLGTFKAFGLNNKMLVRIYVSVILAFLLLGFVLPTILAGILEMLNSIFHFTIVTMFDIRIVLAFIVLFIACFWVSSRTISTILQDTPGNLIYGR